MITENILSRLDKETFWSSKPFPHLVIDNFLPEDWAEEAEKNFPTKKNTSWTPYLHFNEVKYGFNSFKHFPVAIQQIITFLHSETFCHQLATLVNTHKLMPDPDLIGGGLHQTFQNGFLNVHTDFSHHPHKKHWKRKINLLVYLNKNWPAQYEGDLELWDISSLKSEKTISPAFNRAVIFLTDSNSLHGSPKKLKCGQNESRKSIALYYYEEDFEHNKSFRATRYYSANARFLEKVAIETENFLLKIFSQIRYYLKLRH